MKQGVVIPYQLVVYLQLRWSIKFETISSKWGSVSYLDDDESELIAASSAGYKLKLNS